MYAQYYKDIKSEKCETLSNSFTGRGSFDELTSYDVAAYV